VARRPLFEHFLSEVDARRRPNEKGRVTHGLSIASAHPRGLLAQLHAAIDRSQAFACALLVALSLLAFLPGFVAMPPLDRDEPRFAQASKQMLETHDFIAIRFQNEARNKKPVAIYWLQSASVSLGEALGVAQARSQIFLYRIPSLFGAVATVLFTYWAGLPWVGRRQAMLAAALLCATILLGVEARLAKTDAVLTATVVAAMGALARLWTYRADLTATRQRTRFILWLAIAAGVLVKGPITPMIVALAAAALSIKERSALWLRPLVDWRAIGLAALVIAPWFGAIAIETHGAFFSEAVGGDMLGKVAGASEAHGAPPGAYLAAALVTLWPITPLAIILIPTVWRQRGDDAVAFLLAWLVPAWLLFEAVPTKLPHYVLPLYPAIALLVALMIERHQLVVDHIWKRASALLLPLIPVLVTIAIPLATFLYGDRGGIVGAPIAALAAGVALFASLALWRDRIVDASLTAVLAGVLLAFGVYGFVLPRLHAFMLSPRLVAELTKSPCVPTGLATAGYYEPSLIFLTRTDLRLTEGAEAARFLATPGCKGAFVDIRDEEAFAQTAKALGKTPRLLGRVSGVNLNGGRHLDIGVYTNGG
jgi:4-amino-4-deoxy-L-arabinose transferase-like glycosyltransferase